MQITPAVGIPGVSIGDERATVEASLGAPSSGDEARVYYSDTEPGFSVHYDAAQRVELVEVGHSEGKAEVYLDDVQLTFRLMDDVVADLARKGLSGRPVDIGYQYDEGFCIFSMSSQDASDVDGSEYDPDDERLVVEGVGIAPASYWDD